MRRFFNLGRGKKVTIKQLHKMGPSRFKSLSPKLRVSLATWDSNKSRQSIMAKWMS